MSRETKILEVERSLIQKGIFHHESFGWEVAYMPYPSGSNFILALSRETQNPVYPQLVAYEARYQAVQKEISDLAAELRKLIHIRNGIHIEKFNVGVAILLFILFIIPGIIYVANINKNNAIKQKEFDDLSQRIDDIQANIQSLETELTDIVNESRATFFARQV